MGHNAPTLVLMPGLDGTGLLFERFLAALPPEIQTKVIDYPDTPASVEQYASFAASAFPPGRAVLLAESFSGLVALQMLREQQVSVESIIFVASFGEAPRPHLKWLRPIVPILVKAVPLVPAWVWRSFCLGSRASGADILWFKNALLRVTPHTIAHRLQLVLSARFADQPRCTAPAYYLQAKGDRLISSRAPQQLQRAFQHFTLVPVAGPHFLLQAAPLECALLIAGIVLHASRHDAHKTK